jgi:hypothetical protein
VSIDTEQSNVQAVNGEEEAYDWREDLKRLGRGDINSFDFTIEGGTHGDVLNCIFASIDSINRVLYIASFWEYGAVNNLWVARHLKVGGYVDIDGTPNDAVGTIVVRLADGCDALPKDFAAALADDDNFPPVP